MMHNWWHALRQLVEGGKVAGEDWQAVIVRLQTLVSKATGYVPVISALTAPKLEEFRAAPSLSQVNARLALTARICLGKSVLVTSPPRSILI